MVLLVMITNLSSVEINVDPQLNCESGILGPSTNPLPPISNISLVDISSLSVLPPATTT